MPVGRITISAVAGTKRKAVPVAQLVGSGSTQTSSSSGAHAPSTYMYYKPQTTYRKDREAREACWTRGTNLTSGKGEGSLDFAFMFALLYLC